jgi:hypothetical protein
MKEILNELLSEYKDKQLKYLKIASISENNDHEVFKEMIRKAAGCQLMIDEYKRKIDECEN